MVHAIRNLKGSHYLTKMRNRKGHTPLETAMANEGIIKRDPSTLEMLNPKSRKRVPLPAPSTRFVDVLERLGYARHVGYAALKFTRNSLDVAYTILKHYKPDQIGI
eukprot:752078-Amorphochlora_amoeboformis.AAC.1